MGGIAVVHPHNMFNHSENNNKNRRKRTPQKSNPIKNRHLVMGQVKILKRGEPLTNTSSLLEKDLTEDLVLSTTDRLGPEPCMVTKQIRFVDLYAGSGFIISSPPPSSLPVPGFFKNNKCSVLAEDVDIASVDLRRLLRLDLACRVN